MSRSNQEHIEVEPFDREYRLDELLPRQLLTRLGPTWARLIPAPWAIFDENGAIHFSQGSWQDTPMDLIQAALDKARREDHVPAAVAHATGLLLFPIEYEMDIKGYLAIQAARHDSDALDGMGCAGVTLLQQLMRLQHRNRMTSGLHGQVVAESYAQLKEKAAALAHSEEKYRKLAASLEIEVEQKTEEMRLAHARLITQEKLAAIGQLSAGMAHEINNPLGFIISNLDTLTGYADDLLHLVGHYRGLASCCMAHADTLGPGPWVDHCQSVRQFETEVDGDFLLADLPTLTRESMSGAQRIQKIVGDLKIVARPGEHDPEPLDLQAGLDAVLTILADRIGGIQVHRAYGEVPMVHGYPQEINQVWLNLILNALEAMDGSGTLGIETRSAGGEARVMIRDSGHGISPDAQPKIFDPFFTTKKIGQGMGLGLHLAYQVITGHDGRIDVESTQGAGSCFTVRLPAAGGE